MVASCLFTGFNYVQIDGVEITHANITENRFCHAAKHIGFVQAALSLD